MRCSTAVNEPERKYKWPWFFWGAVALFILLAVLAVGYAALKISSERGFIEPLPGAAPMH
jgi:hypothetical protein